MNLRMLYVPQLYPTTTKMVGSISSINMIYDYARKMKGIRTDFWIPEGYDISVFDNQDLPMGVINAFKLGLPQKNHYRGKWIYGVDIDLEMALRDNLLDYDLILFEQGYHVDYYSFVNFERPWGMNVPVKIPMAVYITDGLVDNNLYHHKDNVGEFTLMKGYTLFPYLFATKYDRDVCLKVATKYFIKRNFGSDAYILKPSVDFELIRKEKRQIKDKVVFLHAGPTIPQHNVHVLAKCLEEVTPTVMDKFRLLIISRKVREEYDKKCQKHFSSQVFGLSREQYQKELYECHIIWCGVDYSASGLGFWESIASGMLPLFYGEKKWMKDRKPEWYPLCAKNEEDLKVLLIMMINNYEELYDKYFDRLYEWYKNEMDTNNLQEEARRIFEEITVKQFESKNLPDNYIVDILRNVKIEEGTYEDIGKATKNSSEKGINVLEVLSNPAKRMFLRKAGWDDVISKGKSYWVRK